MLGGMPSAGAAELRPDGLPKPEAEIVASEISAFEARIAADDSGAPPSEATAENVAAAPAAAAANQCILDQIVRDRTISTGAPKRDFDIIMNDLDSASLLWEAPYITHLGQRGDLHHGWVSGDRRGYSGAYMFLVEWTESANGTPNWARVLGRVTFAKASNEAAYIQINDRYMDEIQTTGIKFNGQCGGTSQAEQPDFAGGYDASNDPEVRPVIHYVDPSGEQLEDRSYTNTVSHPNLRFSEHERISQPFTQADGVGGTHTVYERVTVLARYDVDGDGKDFLPAVAVYYDSLQPDTDIGGVSPMPDPGPDPDPDPDPGPRPDPGPDPDPDPGPRPDPDPEPDPDPRPPRPGGPKPGR